MESHAINLFVRFASGVVMPYTVEQSESVANFKKVLMARETLQDVEVCFSKPCLSTRKRRRGKKIILLFFFFFFFHPSFFHIKKKIFFDGKRLDDEKTLADYKIGKEAIVEAKTRQLLRVVHETDALNVLKGAASKVNIVFKIETGEAEQTEKRAPINLSLCLDHSGSMGGDKIEQSRVAVKSCIDALSPEDTLSFVIYDDTAKTIIENGNLSPAGKVELKSRVDRVHASGGTNITCGMEASAKLLGLHLGGAVAGPIDFVKKMIVGESASDEKTDVRPKRMFLFSDGQTGERNLPALAKQVRKKKLEKLFLSHFSVLDQKRRSHSVHVWSWFWIQ